MVMVILYG